MRSLKSYRTTQVKNADVSDGRHAVDCRWVTDLEALLSSGLSECVDGDRDTNGISITFSASIRLIGAEGVQLQDFGPHHMSRFFSSRDSFVMELFQDAVLKSLCRPKRSREICGEPRLYTGEVCGESQKAARGVG
jgi:hypothetical protein